VKIRKQLHSAANKIMVLNIIMIKQIWFFCSIGHEKCKLLCWKSEKL